MLTQDRLKELFSYNEKTGIFTRLVSIGRRGKVGNIAGSKNWDGYLLICIDNKNYAAHRLAWMYTYGSFPKITDHINGIRDDNRISNLREVTMRENLQNRKKQERQYSSLPTGVTVVKWKWIPNAYLARWCDTFWKIQCSPHFNFIKCWWKENALVQAIAYREARIKELISQWASYTERHWK